MILAKFLLRKFFFYLLLSSGGLTLLYNVVEFFEKITRVTHASLSSIFVFIMLRLLPSFFDLLPLGAWLATCLLIHDLAQHNEWETLHILSISPRKLLRLVVIAGASLSLFSFVGKEYAIATLAKKMATFKMEQFKENAHKKVYHRWFMLSDTTYAYLTFLDLTTQKGEDFLLLVFDKHFQLVKRISCVQFFVKPLEAKIIAPEAKIFTFADKACTMKQNYEIQLPQLFALLNMQAAHPTITELARNLFYGRNLFNKATLHKELTLLLSRFFAHSQPMIYMLLTFCLFFLFSSNILRWLAMLAVYPLFVFITSFVEFIVLHGFPVWIITLPYIGTILLLLVFKRALAQ